MQQSLRHSFMDLWPIKIQADVLPRMSSVSPCTLAVADKAHYARRMPHRVAASPTVGATAQVPQQVHPLASSGAMRSTLLLIQTPIVAGSTRISFTAVLHRTGSCWRYFWWSIGMCPDLATLCARGRRQRHPLLPPCQLSLL